MQAVINDAAGLGAASRIHFAGSRDYMMRSEKRGARPSPSGGQAPKPPRPKKPRKRRRRAGFFYKLFMMLLLVTLWPLGMVMLFQRKVRWGGGTKLLTSVVTLAACIILIGFLLTVDTGNAQYSALQNTVNDFLDDTADSLVIVWEETETRAMMVSHSIQDLSEAAWLNVRDDIADGIDAGIAIADNAKATVLGWISGTETETVDAEPEITPEAIAAATAAPEATVPPVAEISVNADASELPVYIPQTVPAGGEEIEAGELTRDGEIDTSAAPEALPADGAAKVFTVKPAANAVVYYNDGGKCYHMTSSCGSMRTADEHILGDTVGSSVHRCSTCKTPDKSILDEEFIVWTDGKDTAHLSDDCEKFSGKWNIIPAADAIERKLTACYECDADEYLAAIAMKQEIAVEAPVEEPEEEMIQPESGETEARTEEAGETADVAGEESDAAVLSEAENTPVATDAAQTAEPTEAPTEEPTEDPTEAPTTEPTAGPTAEPTAEPTPEPTAEPTEEPKAALKPAGQAKVYHTKNGKWFHTIENCSGMMGASEYTLEDSADKYKSCNACSAPKKEMIGKDCLWMDKNKLCHTTDECEAFEGRYTLLTVDDALEKKHSACEKCGADDYLGSINVVGGEVVYYEEITVIESNPAQ